jgi:hypothetical protein
VFLSPARINLYHQLLPVTTLTRGLLIDLLLLGLLGGIAFTLLDRATPRLKQILWLPVFFVTAWIVGRDISTSVSNSILRGHLLRTTPYVPALVLTVVLALLLFTPGVYSKLVRIASLVFAAGGIALLLAVIPRLGLACFSRAPQEQAGFTRPVSNPGHPGELHIVWILFDELSYRQAFEHPQPGIVLPAFAKVAAESITFSQLLPVGDQTQRVIPSLLLGEPVADVESDASGNLLLRHTRGAPWQHFDQNATIFAAAKRQGWGTGVSGWYNPYCRILNTVLDSCYWTFNEPVASELFSRLSSRQSSWQNARDGLPLAARIEALWRNTPPNQPLHDDYQNILRTGEALIQDPDIQLAFIHMSVPHPPGLLRNPSGEHEFGYLGNLVLADQVMAQLLKSLDTSPAAANTVLIVSSDHSWRTFLWRGMSDWSKVEEHASDGGVFDQRAVLMVRFPHQTRAEQIDRPESVMIVHRLLLDLIAGRVRTADDWIATLPPAAINQADNKK